MTASATAVATTCRVVIPEFLIVEKIVEKMLGFAPNAAGVPRRF
jgi:hypothetical protein